MVSIELISSHMGRRAAILELPIECDILLSGTEPIVWIMEAIINKGHPETWYRFIDDTHIQEIDIEKVMIKIQQREAGMRGCFDALGVTIEMQRSVDAQNKTKGFNVNNNQ